MILFKKNNVDPRKYFMRPLTKKLTTSYLTPLETIQLLSETFFATSDNNRFINQNDTYRITYIFLYHFFTYPYPCIQKYPWVKILQQYCTY